MDARLWTFDDIKDATARHEACRNTDDPVRHYYYGVALEMSGQSENADEKYLAFRFEIQRKFGNLASGAAHYRAKAAGMEGGGDARSSDHYENMARILGGPEPAARKAKKCVVSWCRKCMIFYVLYE